MGLTIDTANNVYIKVGDPITLEVTTTGDILAEVGDTAKFMIKSFPSDPDDQAILTKDITVTVANTITIFAPTSETSLLNEGSYYWSVKHTKSGNTYTIVPDGGNERYPAFTIGRVLING